MSHLLRRVVPVAALCFATLLGGCVVVPERRAHVPSVYVPGPVVVGGWGWRHRH